MHGQASGPRRSPLCPNGFAAADLRGCGVWGGMADNMPVARPERFVYDQSMDVGRHVDAALTSLHFTGCRVGAALTITWDCERYWMSSLPLGKFFYVYVFCDAIKAVLGRNRIRACDRYRKRFSRDSFHGSSGSCTSS
jgi:hypothetical protein